MKEEIEVIGIDHGYKNMKTATEFFPTALTKLNEKPDDLSGVIFFKEEYYSVHGNPIISVENHDKTKTNAFYILTLVSIAIELKKRGKRKATVRIAGGLPQKWYQSQKKEFKQHLKKNGEVFFQYEGTSYNVIIQDADIFTQGYAAALSMVSRIVAKKIKTKISPEQMNYYVIVDIGGETIDIIPVENGKINNDRCKIETRATIWLHNEIFEAVEAELYSNINEPYLIEYIKNSDKTSKPKNEYERVIQAKLTEYASYIQTRLKEFKINIDIVPIIFVGGGASIIEKFGTNDKYYFEFVTDICANAKGYEQLEKVFMKK